MRLVFLLGLLSPIIATFAVGQVSYDESYDLHRLYEWLRNYFLDEVYNGAAQFSGKFIEEVAKENKKNLIISPISAWLVLSLASFGARETTESVLLRVLGHSPFNDERKFYLQSLVDQVNSYKAVELSVANAAFISSSIRVNPKFAEICGKTFQSPVQGIDFKRSSEASNIINSWCAKKTANSITKIVDPDDLNVNTRFVLVNAVYFKGKWRHPFRADYTRDGPFFREDGTQTTLSIMFARHEVLYGDYPEVNSNFIELPFVSEDAAHNMSMFIILPKENNDFPFLEENLHKIDLQRLLSRGRYVETFIHLPKFVIENEIDLKKPLIRMNMTELFDPKRADFSGIVAPPGSSVNARNPQIFIDKIVQKAYIEVNEEGSEASAVTVAAATALMGGDMETFNANRPFYAIIATTGDNPLNVFTARFTGYD